MSRRRLLMGSDRNKRSKKAVEKSLTLRRPEASALGRIITYLQEDPSNQVELGSATLQGRFLPFAMDRDEPGFRETAIRCANDCEAWAKAIREHAGLEVYSPVGRVVLPSQDSDEVAEDLELDTDESFKVEGDEEMGF